MITAIHLVLLVSSVPSLSLPCQRLTSIASSGSPPQSYSRASISQCGQRDTGSADKSEGMKMLVAVLTILSLYARVHSLTRRTHSQTQQQIIRALSRWLSLPHNKSVLTPIPRFRAVEAVAVVMSTVRISGSRSHLFVLIFCNFLTHASQTVNN